MTIACLWGRNKKLFPRILLFSFFCVCVNSMLTGTCGLPFSFLAIDIDASQFLNPLPFLCGFFRPLAETHRKAQD